MNIDIAIVAVFLFLNLSVGLYYGRGVTNIKEYALGGRNFTTAALVSTIVATAVTGSMFTIGICRTYTDGLYDLLPTCGIALSLCLSAAFIIPRMKSFLGSISIAEALGDRYGKHVRIITAIGAIIANIGGIAVQYKVLGSVVSYFLGADIVSAVIITGVIVTLYSAFGGIRSVTFTDILQFMVFGTVIPLIGIILWKTTVMTEGFSYEIVLQNKNFQLSSVFDYNDSNFWAMILLFLYYSIPSSYPAVFQRIMMSKNLQQAQRAFNISSIVQLIIICSVAWIGFLLLALNPNLNPDELIPHIIDNYSYNGLRGFIIVGVMSMVMSSADSFINVASVLAVHDIYKPIKLEVKNELLLTRITAIIIGIGPIFFALSSSDLLQMILYANAFYMPLVTAPLLLTIFGFKTTKTTVLLGMSAGFWTVILWRVVGINFDPIIPATLLNLSVMMLVHYFGNQPGGWIKIDMEEPKVQGNELERLNVFTSIYHSIKNFNFIAFIHKNSPRDEATYSFFGVFCFISTLSTIYLTQRELIGVHSDLITYLYSGMLVISTFFGLHMMWSDRMRNPIFVSIIWHIALIYNMTFCASFFLLLSNFHAVQITVFTLSLMILFNLCRWKTAITVILLGVGSGIVMYKTLVADITLSEVMANYYLVTYVALIVSASLFAFYKPKEDFVDHLDFQIYKSDKQINSLNQKIYYLETKVNGFSDEIRSGQQEIEQLKNEINDRERKIVELAEAIRNSKRNVQELSNSSSINDERFEEIKREIKEREAELKKMQNLVHTDKNRIEILQHEVVAKGVLIQNLDIEIVNSKHQVSVLREEIQKREEEISQLNDKVTFFKERTLSHEREIERLGETSQRILNNVTHELRLPISNVMNFAEMLSEEINKWNKEELKILSDEVLYNSTRLSTMILNMLDLATMDVKKSI
jgi:Na+/proline symporter/predicted  nucleic acid-binding Zn-ribbon protein